MPRISIRGSDSADLKKKILKMLKADPKSISELSRELNLRRDFVSGFLTEMEDKGQIKSVYVGRSKVYMVK
jgi:predicted transcriptional regulator